MITANGARVVFQSLATNLIAADGNGTSDIFRYDLASGSVSRVSLASDGAEAHGASSFAAVSGDGTVTAFQSAAPDLVSGDTLGVVDIFARIEPPAPPVSPTATPPGGTPGTPDAGTPSPSSTPSAMELPETGAATGGTGGGPFTAVTAVVLATAALAGMVLALRSRGGR
jgi:hypothetical protein